MKRIALLLALCSIAHAQQLLAPAPNQITVTIRLCAPNQDSDDWVSRPLTTCQERRAEWSRLKDEQDMSALIIDDFRDAQAHKLTPATRSRIIAIAKRLAKNAYY